jgi:chromosome segregation ATPase
MTEPTAAALAADARGTIAALAAELTRVSAERDEARDWARTWKECAKGWKHVQLTWHIPLTTEFARLRRLLAKRRAYIRRLHGMVRRHRTDYNHAQQRAKATAKALVEQQEALQAERDAARAEVAALRAALVDIRKDVHFVHTTVYSPGKWSELCEDVLRRIDAVTPNNHAGKAILAALDAVLWFWECDPEAFGDDASVTTLAGRFAAVANQVRAARRPTE